MFKKYRLVVTILLVGMLSGGLIQSVDAAATMDAPKQERNHAIYDTGKQQTEHWYYQDWKSFCKQFYLGKNMRYNPGKDYTQKPVETIPVVPEWNQNSNQNNVPNQEKEIEKTPTEDKNQSVVSGLNEFEQEVFALTNQERIKNGLPAFQIDLELSRVAREKSRDIQINNYFDHNSPVYGSPFDMMEAYGINYRTAGENIAKGQRSPSEVVNAWMNSEGHRANILNGSFTHIGLGYYADGNVWTQQFIGQ